MPCSANPPNVIWLPSHILRPDRGTREDRSTSPDWTRRFLITRYSTSPPCPTRTLVMSVAGLNIEKFAVIAWKRDECTFAGGQLGGNGKIPTRCHIRAQPLDTHAERVFKALGRDSQPDGQPLHRLAERNCASETSEKGGTRGWSGGHSQPRNASNRQGVRD